MFWGVFFWTATRIKRQKSAPRQNWIFLVEPRSGADVDRDGSEKQTGGLTGGLGDVKLKVPAQACLTAISVSMSWNSTAAKLTHCYINPYVANLASQRWKPSQLIFLNPDIAIIAETTTDIEKPCSYERSCEQLVNKSSEWRWPCKRVVVSMTVDVSTHKIFLSCFSSHNMRRNGECVTER